jgi:soluble calcium-activated nucleotidase 1
MIHESGVWSEIYQKWFFLPRRASTETYTEEADERRAANILFTSDEHFTDITQQRIGPFNPVRGFSSFKFVPGTSDTVIVALKSEEDKGNIASYITVFTLEGDILLEETLLEGNYKFEGIGFI